MWSLPFNKWGNYGWDCVRNLPPAGMVTHVLWFQIWNLPSRCLSFFSNEWADLPMAHYSLALLFQGSSCWLNLQGLTPWILTAPNPRVKSHSALPNTPFPNLPCSLEWSCDPVLANLRCESILRGFTCCWNRQPSLGAPQRGFSSLQVLNIGGPLHTCSFVFCGFSDWWSRRVRKY